MTWAVGRLRDSSARRGSVAALGTTHLGATATFKDGALETRVVQPFGERFVRITQGRSRLAPPEPELWDVVGDAARQVHRWTQPSERGRRAVHVLIVDLGDTEAEVVSNLDNEDALAIAASLQVFP